MAGCTRSQWTKCCVHAKQDRDKSRLLQNVKEACFLCYCEACWITMRDAVLVLQSRLSIPATYVYIQCPWIAFLTTHHPCRGHARPPGRSGLGLVVLHVLTFTVVFTVIPNGFGLDDLADKRVRVVLPQKVNETRVGQHLT